MPLFSSEEMLLSSLPRLFQGRLWDLGSISLGGSLLCHAFPGEHGQQSLLTMCLNFSDLFPLIFPSGKWITVPQ